ncbi:MAG: hypothetical protein K8R68_05740 [Bacteroidales bacterium]|nr:hypothetical protein [Bacteroidales bacterium]
MKITFEDQLKARIFFHLEENSPGRHLIQVLKEDDSSFAPPNMGLRHIITSFTSTL